jgi:hypothetical protein
LQVTHVIALFDYVPVSDEELSLKKGQRVAILATDENRKGWIYAQGEMTHLPFFLPGARPDLPLFPSVNRKWQTRLVARELRCRRR